MNKITKRILAYVLGAVLGAVIGVIWLLLDPEGIPDRMISLIMPAAGSSGDLMMPRVCMGGIAFVLPFYLLLWILIGVTATLAIRKGIGVIRKIEDADEYSTVNQSAKNSAQAVSSDCDKPSN